MSSYIENIATNFLIGKHTLRVFTGKFEKIVGKILFGFFIMCLSQLVAFGVTLTSYDVAYCHAYIYG